jgi:hypothetical protein
MLPTLAAALRRTMSSISAAFGEVSSNASSISTSGMPAAAARRRNPDT